MRLFQALLRSCRVLAPSWRRASVKLSSGLCRRKLSSDTRLQSCVISQSVCPLNLSRLVSRRSRVEPDLRSFAAEGSTFWLSVSAAYSLYFGYLVSFPPTPLPSHAQSLTLAYAAVAVGIVQATLAYACWIMKRLAFAVSAIMAAILILLSLVVGGTKVFSDSVISAAIGILQLLVIVHSYRAYRELRKDELPVRR